MNLRACEKTNAGEEEFLLRDADNGKKSDSEGQRWGRKEKGIGGNHVARER